jgi:photosystem II stability/assembly factor-like uncharacterized protein
MKKLINICLFTLIQFTSFAQWEKLESQGCTNLIGNVDSLICYVQNAYGGPSLKVSFDKGKTWTNRTNGLVNAPINDVIKIGKTLVLASSQGVYKSDDFGLNWFLQNINYEGGFSKLAYSNNTLYVTWSGSGRQGMPLFRSKDMGRTWERFGPVIYDEPRGFGVSGDFIIYSAYTSTLVSIDGGKTFNYDNRFYNITSVSTTDKTIFIGSGSRVGTFSTDGGKTWQGTPYGMTKTFIGDKLWLGATTNAVYISTNSGSTWSDISVGLPKNPSSYNIGELAGFGDYLYFSSYIRPLAEIRPDFLIGPTNLVVKAAYRDAVELEWDDNSTIETGYTIERRKNNSTLLDKKYDLPANTKSFRDLDVVMDNEYFYKINAKNANGTSKYSNVSNTKIYKTICNDEINQITPTPSVVSFANQNNVIAAGIGSFIISNDGGQTWEMSNEFMNKHKTFSPTFLETPDNKTWYMYSAGYPNKLLKTKDSGKSWEYAPTPSLPSYFSSYPLNMKFFSVDTGFVFHTELYFTTTDGGNTWQQQNYKVNNSIASVSRVQFLNSKLGFFFTGEIIGKTIDGGKSWDTNTKYNGRSGYFISEKLGFAWSDINRPIERTSDGGKTWEKLSLLNVNVDKIYFLDESVGFIVSYNKVYRTLNAGVVWEEITPPFTHYDNFKDISGKNNNVVLVGGGYVYASSDKGKTWQQKYQRMHFGEHIDTFDGTNMIVYSQYFTQNAIEYFYSENSGKNFKTKSFLKEYVILRMNVLSDKSLIVFAKNKERYQNYNDVVILKSNDGGENWRHILKYDDTYGPQIKLIFRNTNTLIYRTGVGLVVSKDNGNSFFFNENLKNTILHPQHLISIFILMKIDFIYLT